MKKYIVIFLSFTLLLTMSQTSVNVSANEELTEEEKQREELREIWDDYQATTSSLEMTTMAIACGPDICLEGDGGGEPDPTTHDPGNIMMALDSITDHVGIIKDRYYIIDAHPANSNGGVDYTPNNWETRYNELKGLVVIGATAEEKAAAVSYATQQIGEPYDITSGHWTEDEWYCSKLVWRAWYEQGYDIEGRYFEPRGTHVTPGDILDSPLTSVFYST